MVGGLFNANGARAWSREHGVRTSNHEPRTMNHELLRGRMSDVRVDNHEPRTTNYELLRGQRSGKDRGGDPQITPMK